MNELAPSTTSMIAAFNFQLGEGDIIAYCDLKIAGLLIRRVSVRRGRQGSVFVNFPAIRANGEWIKVVEIGSQALAEQVERVVLAAVGEFTR